MEYSLVKVVVFYGELYIYRNLTQAIEHGLVELESKVNQEMLSGWSPQGGVSLTYTKDFVVVIQAIIK